MGDIILGILETSRHDVPSSLALLVDHSIGPSFLILYKGVQISMMVVKQGCSCVTTDKVTIS